MPTDRSPGGRRFGKVPQPNDPPSETPFFGATFDHVRSGRTSKLRHRGDGRVEEDEDREEDGSTLPTVARERRRQRELDAISTQAIAGDLHERTRPAAPQAPVALPGDRGPRRRHGSGESNLFFHGRDRRTAHQFQPPETRQMSGELERSLALGPYRGPPARRAPESSPPAPRRSSKSNPEPQKTLSPDNRGYIKPEERLRKRVRNPPSLAGFSRFICPPWGAKKSVHLAPPHSKYEMSGALGSPPSVKPRGRSPVKRERLASNEDVVRSEHRSSRHSGRSNGSQDSAQNQVPKGRRGSRREHRLNVDV